MYSFRSVKFSSVSVYSVVLLPFLTWLAATTSATVINVAIAVGSNVNAILFAKAATVTAAIAELPLLLWAVLLPLDVFFSWDHTRIIHTICNTHNILFQQFLYFAG